jgi:hypothetical protein
MQNPYERIIGGTEEERRDAFDTLQQMFNEKPEDFAQFELEKTQEDLAVINKTVETVDEIVASYGGDPKPFPVEKYIC